MKIRLLAGLLFAFTAAVAAAGDLKLTITPDRKDAVYKTGDSVKFRVLLTDGTGKEVTGRKIACVIKEEFCFRKRLELISGKDVSVTWKYDKPGSVQLYATLLDDQGKPVLKTIQKPKEKKPQEISTGCGAFFSPDKIIPGAEMPKDFDAFWNAQKALLKQMPMNPKMVKLPPARGKENYIVYDITLDCPGGMPVRGYLVMPKDAKPKSLKAVLQYQGAGVRDSYKRFYKEKVMTLDINAHGIENGKPLKYYEDLKNGKLKGYPHFGKASRETSYFRGMYLRVLRSLEFMKSLPEWDGKTLIVRGGSQGGGQSIAAAALDPDVTFCYASVPALSDHAAGKFGRRAGWPYFYSWKNGKPDFQNVADTAQYFDNVNFAKKIRCEIFLATGFIDNVCSPAGVIAVYRSLPAGTKKHFRANPWGNHGSSGSSDAEKRFREIIQ